MTNEIYEVTYSEKRVAPGTVTLFTPSRKETILVSAESEDAMFDKLNRFWEDKKEPTISRRVLTVVKKVVL